MPDTKDMDDFYSSDLGESVGLDVTTTTARVASDLEAYRWLVQVYDVVTATKVWIKLGDDTVVATLAAPSFLVYGGGVQAVEFNARPGKNRIAAICDAGTAKVLLTPVSARA